MACEKATDKQKQQQQQFVFKFVCHLCGRQKFVRFKKPGARTIALLANRLKSAVCQLA